MFEDSFTFRFDRSARPSPRAVSQRLALSLSVALLLLCCVPAYALAASLSLVSEDVSEIKALGAIQDTEEKIAPQIHSLAVEGLGFAPRALLARAGDEIALENHSLYPLTLTLDRRGSPPATVFSGRLDSQKSIRIPLKDAGDYILSSAEFSSLVLPIRILTAKQRALPITLDATGRGHTPLVGGKTCVMLYTDNFYTTNTVEVADGDKAFNGRLSTQDGKWRLETIRHDTPEIPSVAPQKEAAPAPVVKAAPPPPKPSAPKPEPPKAAPKPAAAAEKAKPQAPKAEKATAEKKKEEKPAPKPDAPKAATKPGTFNLKVIED